MKELKSHFRFEDLDIWRDSICLFKEFKPIIEKLERSKRFRIASQLEGAVLSISNNIAEGSGSTSIPDYRRYLSYSRSSVFECANIIFVLKEIEFLDESAVALLLEKLDHLSRKIASFSYSLR